MGAPVYLDQAKVFVGIGGPDPIGVFRLGILCVGVGQAAGGEIIEWVWFPVILGKLRKMYVARQHGCASGFCGLNEVKQPLSL